jgi:hypothetical protein
MSYPVYSFFSINLTNDSSGQGRAEIVGKVKIDWGKWLAKQSVLDCLEFGDPDDIMAANTPNITELEIPPPA